MALLPTAQETFSAEVSGYEYSGASPTPRACLIEYQDLKSSTSPVPCDNMLGTIINSWH